MRKVIEYTTDQHPYTDKEQKLIYKLDYLSRLVKLYARFLSLWRTADVYSDLKEVKVRFYMISKYGYESFTERTFPIEDLPKRIVSYKNKVRKAFCDRHNNPRVLRDIERHQRKINNNIKEYAEVQMYESEVSQTYRPRLFS